MVYLEIKKIEEGKGEEVKEKKEEGIEEHNKQCMPRRPALIIAIIIKVEEEARGKRRRIPTLKSR